MKTFIQVIPGHQVDRDKWDRRISSSPNGMIYARADYLDHLAVSWSAIVVNDYETVMPVPWKKKLGIRYACTVPFIQQLGIFPEENSVHEELLATLFTNFRYGDYPFNWGNLSGQAERGVHAEPGKISADGNNFTVAMRSNYTLRLDRPYAMLEKQFSVSARQHIRSSQQRECIYKTAGIEEAVSVYQELYAARMRVGCQYFTAFKKLCRLLAMEGGVVARKVVDPAGRLLASVVLLKDNRRLYNIMQSTLPEGRLRRANYFLLSEIWKEYAESDYIFDFEGSELPGVRHFYRKFGTVDQPYPQIHFNRLPYPLRWLKK